MNSQQRDRLGRFAPGQAGESDVDLSDGGPDLQRQVDDVLDAVRQHAAAGLDDGEPWGPGDPTAWTFGDTTRQTIADEVTRLRTEYPEDVAEFEAARPGRFGRALADRLVGVEHGSMPTGFEVGMPGGSSPLDDAVEPLGSQVVRNTDGTVDLVD